MSESISGWDKDRLVFVTRSVLLIVRSESRGDTDPVIIDLRFVPLVLESGTSIMLSFVPRSFFFNTEELIKAGRHCPLLCSAEVRERTKTGQRLCSLRPVPCSLDSQE